MAEKIKYVTIIVLLTLIAALAVPAALAQAPAQRTLLENLSGMGEFSTLVNAAKAAGLGDALGGATAYTLFAPTNAAFGKLPGDAVNALLSDKPLLGNLLKNHVVPGKISYADLGRMAELKTIDGKTLPVGRQNGAITVGGVVVPDRGIQSSNGIIYPVDTVMAPPGFAMPQAPAAPAAPAAPGIPWDLIGLLLGALILGGLLLWLLTRGKRHEERRITYEEKPRVEERARTEETVRETLEPAEVTRESSMMDMAKGMALPLSGTALVGLNELISRGIFKDKTDFLGFLGRAYAQNNMDTAISKSAEPGESTIMDIINRTGIARGFGEGEARKYIVPLLITGFMALYNYVHKRPAARPM
jgi:uncharacterized surface protein with fasciclin (FAS1) repeats